MKGRPLALGLTAQGAKLGLIPGVLVSAFSLHSVLSPGDLISLFKVSTSSET